jgi:glucokinase
MESTHLIGDISATNSTLAIIKDNKITNIKHFKTSNFKNLSELVFTYLKEKNCNIEKASFGIAGPINTKLKLTQNKIKIDKTNIVKKLKTKKVFFLNDFVALSHSIISLKKTELLTLNKGINSKNNILVIGAGTGLGISYLKYEKNNYRIIPTEYKNLKFDLENNELEKELKEFLNKKKLIYEDLLSGKGIETLYSYLQKTKYVKEKTNLSAEKISKSKKKNKCSKETFKLFFNLYAKAIKQLVILKKCYGGVYIAGGVIQKNLDFNKKQFLEEIQKNQKLKNTQINIIKDYNTSLIGLKNYLNKK